MEMLGEEGVVGEEGGGFGGDGFGSLVEIVVDFEDGWGAGGESVQEVSDAVPVDCDWISWVFVGCDGGP